MKVRIFLNIFLISTIFIFKGCGACSSKKAAAPDSAKGDNTTTSGGSSGGTALLTVRAADETYLRMADTYPLQSYKKPLLSVMVLRESNVAEDPNDDVWDTYPVPAESPVFLNFMDSSDSGLYSVEIESGNIVAVAFVLGDLTTFFRQGDGCIENEVSQGDTTFLLMSTDPMPSTGVSVVTRYASQTDEPARMWNVKNGMQVVSNLVSATQLVMGRFPITYADANNPVNLTVGFLDVIEGNPDNCQSTPPNVTFTVGTAVDNEPGGGGDLSPAITDHNNDADIAASTSDTPLVENVDYETTCKNYRKHKINLPDKANKQAVISTSKFSDAECKTSPPEWSMSAKLNYDFDDGSLAHTGGTGLLYGSIMNFLTTVTEITVVANTAATVTAFNTTAVGGITNYTAGVARTVTSLADSLGPVVGQPYQIIAENKYWRAAGTHVAMGGEYWKIFYINVADPNEIATNTFWHPDHLPIDPVCQAGWATGLTTLCVDTSDPRLIGPALHDYLNTLPE